MELTATEQLVCKEYGKMMAEEAKYRACGKGHLTVEQSAWLSYDGLKQLAQDTLDKANY